jgi:hypothetical protein
MMYEEAFQVPALRRASSVSQQRGQEVKAEEPDELPRDHQDWPNRAEPPGVSASQDRPAHFRPQTSRPAREKQSGMAQAASRFCFFFQASIPAASKIVLSGMVRVLS